MESSNCLFFAIVLEISTILVIEISAQFVVKDSRTSQYDTTLLNRARQYTIDTVATTSAASSSLELTPSVTSTTTNRKILEAVPEVDAANVVHANPETRNGMATNKEKSEAGRNNVENTQSFMEEEDVERPSSPQPSPIPPVDNLKYLSVSPPRSCASLTVRAIPRVTNEISTRSVICKFSGILKNWKISSI